MPTPQEIAPRAHESILARERDWADRHGLALDPAGHLVDATEGLCFSPDAEQRARLERHPERPLGEPGAPGKPSPVGQLGSAWSLACNLLEAIPNDGLEALLAVLGTPGSAVRRGWVHPAPEVEAPSGRTPLLRIDREAGAPVFVDVVGAEIARRDAGAGALPVQATAGWGDLEGCRRLADEALHGASVIPLGGLLQRIRTLSRSHGRRGFRYVVVRPHFDAPFDEALRRGFDGLRVRIGGEVDFDALDLSTLLGRLARASEGAHPALGWLADRYLDETVRTPA